MARLQPKGSETPPKLTLGSSLYEPCHSSTRPALMGVKRKKCPPWKKSLPSSPGKTRVGGAQRRLFGLVARHAGGPAGVMGPSKVRATMYRTRSTTSLVGVKQMVLKTLTSQGALCPHFLRALDDFFTDAENKQTLMPCSYWGKKTKHGSKASFAQSSKLMNQLLHKLCRKPWSCFERLPSTT